MQSLGSEQKLTWMQLPFKYDKLKVVSIAPHNLETPCFLVKSYCFVANIGWEFN